ncbi:2-polyprenyl-6-methoxyphenol hydroxylase-like FAD-dependent oxidoreductase [Pedobacter psychrotolerans]|uniref:Flavin-dependent monooxygenase n=1 Tax=Pedobacter psychrotolerans TaxID=1843235 RepID=A0A4R2HLJ1_9SPHI|nr:NAD(P)/FAD-dependent oxidoreductase [Pedobacter psychrotolerans]TCO30753.1 2-polyprenyl-6-methoxyphenol hydroxylase-like FAD-dependent oxidoreductase [Pedobacter psychrotolerans]GGE44693.1 tetracycline resistance protein [Pedobacter psychrotolerans]
MLLENKKIAIVGGGPGGLTLARLLQQKNVDVKVYERDIDRHARVQGSPLDLHEHSGLAALREANLLDEFRNSYMIGADKTTITNEQADIVFSDHENKQTEAFGDEHFRPEIDRGVLRSILIDSLAAENLIWNSQFLAMERQGEGWLLNFKDGKSEYADVVIGSDGANSKIRPYLTDVKPFYSGITMLEGNIYDAEKKAPKISAILRGGKIMAFGNQKNILMGQKSNGEIGFYASFKAEENWAEKSGLDFSNKSEILKWFKTAYAEWNEIWQELFENATTPYIPRPINCMPLDQSWKTMPNLTIIGDAAHLMPPFAGEGANMAMLDALELSKMLLSDKHKNLQQAISFYEIEMRKRASSKAKESLENGEKMHSKNALSVMTSFFSGQS